MLGKENNYLVRCECFNVLSTEVNTEIPTDLIWMGSAHPDSLVFFGWAVPIGGILATKKIFTAQHNVWEAKVFES